VEGAELLGERIEQEKVLDEEDLRKIKLLKLKRGAQNFKSIKLEEEEKEESESEGESIGEGGEDEIEEIEEGIEIDEPVLEEEGGEEVWVSDDELSDEEEEADENPHGFVFAHSLDTFKKSKREKVEEQKNDLDKEAHRNKFKRRDKKGGGSTNKAKQKSKPFQMVKYKKQASLMESYQSTKAKIKGLKKQIGKFKKNQKQRFKKKQKGLK